MNILREVCEILHPISIFTNEMQATHGTSGMIIPAIEIILNELDEGDITLVLRDIIKERFAYLKLDKFFWIANCLDPRFALETFEKEDYMRALKQALKIVMEHNNITVGENKKQDVVEPEREHSIKKRKNLFPVKRFSDSHLQGVSEDIIDMELTLFRAEARMIHGIIDVDPARWWVRNSSKFPLMSQLSMIYLLAPASTSDVERLFSVAGRICRPHRS